MRRGGALRHPDRSAPRLGLRFAVGIGHLCQIKFWLMHIKRIAIVALARKLIAALWRYLTTGLVPEHAVLKAKA